MEEVTAQADAVVESEKHHGISWRQPLEEEIKPTSQMGPISVGTAEQRNRLTTAATLVGEGDEEDSEGWETDYDSDFDPEGQSGIGEIITAEILSDSSDSDDEVEPVAPPRVPNSASGQSCRGPIWFWT